MTFRHPSKFIFNAPVKVVEFFVLEIFNSKYVERCLITATNRGFNTPYFPKEYFFKIERAEGFSSRNSKLLTKSSAAETTDLFLKSGFWIYFKSLSWTLIC